MSLPRFLIDALDQDLPPRSDAPDARRPNLRLPTFSNLAGQRDKPPADGRPDDEVSPLTKAQRYSLARAYVLEYLFPQDRYSYVRHQLYPAFVANPPAPQTAEQRACLEIWQSMPAFQKYKIARVGADVPFRAYVASERLGIPAAAGERQWAAITTDQPGGRAILNYIQGYGSQLSRGAAERVAYSGIRKPILNDTLDDALFGDRRTRQANDRALQLARNSVQATFAARDPAQPTVDDINFLHGVVARTLDNAETAHKHDLGLALLWATGVRIVELIATPEVPTKQSANRMYTGVHMELPPEAYNNRGLVRRDARTLILRNRAKSGSHGRRVHANGETEEHRIIFPYHAGRLLHAWNYYKRVISEQPKGNAKITLRTGIGMHFDDAQNPLGRAQNGTLVPHHPNPDNGRPVLRHTIQRMGAAIIAYVTRGDINQTFPHFAQSFLGQASGVEQYVHLQFMGLIGAGTGAFAHLVPGQGDDETDEEEEDIIRM